MSPLFRRPLELALLLTVFAFPAYANQFASQDSDCAMKCQAKAHPNASTDGKVADIKVPAGQVHDGCSKKPITTPAGCGCGCGNQSGGCCGGGGCAPVHADCGCHGDCAKGCGCATNGNDCGCKLPGGKCPCGGKTKSAAIQAVPMTPVSFSVTHSAGHCDCGGCPVKKPDCGCHGDCSQNCDCKDGKTCGCKHDSAKVDCGDCSDDGGCDDNAANDDGVEGCLIPTGV